MTPPRKSESGGNQPATRSFDLQRAEQMAELEGRVTNGEGKYELLRNSVDSLKKVVETDHATLNEIKGGMKVLIALGSVALGVITIGLTIISLILKR